MILHNLILVLLTIVMKCTFIIEDSFRQLRWLLNDSGRNCFCWGIKSSILMIAMHAYCFVLYVKAEPVFVNLLRSLGIGSQRGVTDFSETISGHLKRLLIRAMNTLTCSYNLKNSKNILYLSDNLSWFSDMPINAQKSCFKFMPVSYTLQKSVPKNIIGVFLIFQRRNRSHWCKLNIY